MSEPTSEDINTLCFTSLAEGLQKNFKRVEEVMADFTKSYEDMELDPFNLSSAYKEWLAALGNNPQELLEANMAYMQNAADLYQRSVMGLLGIEAEPVIREQKGDRRFHHEDWTEKPVFNAIKQSYLLASQWMRGLVSDLDGLDEQTAKKLFTAKYPALLDKEARITDVRKIEETSHRELGGQEG